jgi:hypothetical protein
VADRLLIVDASMNKRIATELRYRGYAARSLSQLGEHQGRQVRHLEDPDLIPYLTERFRDVAWTLVTSDDNMPNEHEDVLGVNQATVATIDPYSEDKLEALTADVPLLGDEQNQNVEAVTPEDMWQRETVHRWAHRMATQGDATIRRYYPRAPSRPWISRR